MLNSCQRLHRERTTGTESAKDVANAIKAADFIPSHDEPDALDGGLLRGRPCGPSDGYPTREKRHACLGGKAAPSHATRRRRRVFLLSHP